MLTWQVACESRLEAAQVSDAEIREAATQKMEALFAAWNGKSTNPTFLPSTPNKFASNWVRGAVGEIRFYSTLPACLLAYVPSKVSKLDYDGNAAAKNQHKTGQT